MIITVIQNGRMTKIRILNVIAQVESGILTGKKTLIIAFLQKQWCFHRYISIIVVVQNSFSSIHYVVAVVQSSLELFIVLSSSPLTLPNFSEGSWFIAFRKANVFFFLSFLLFLESFPLF